MNLKRVIAFALAAGSAGVLAAAAQTPPAAQTVAQIHWQGINQISTDPDATHFFSIWNLPETIKWKAEILEKISRAPWPRFHGGDLSTTNPASVLLRPLLDDVVQSESYTEVRGTDSQSGQLAFAIRLNETRAQLWQTNLQTALALLTEIQPVADQRGWWLKKHHAPDLIQFARVGTWTLVGAAEGTNTLFADFVARIERDRLPFPQKVAGNLWLQADVDVAPTLRALSRNWNPPFQLPRVSLMVAGDQGFVRTRGDLDFAKPLDLQMEPWQIPTNLIRQPIEAFTAIRGIAPWLASRKAWSDLQVGPPPNQWFFESLGGFWAQTFFVASVPDPTNRLNQIAGQLVDRGTPWLAGNGIGNFQRASKFDGVIWGSVPFVAPDLHAISGTNGNFIVGEVFPIGISTNHPQGLFTAMSEQPDLVYYNWELTGPRLEEELRLGQLFRMFFYRPQLPSSSPSIKWFAAMAPKLADSVTTVEEISPTRLSLNRRSTIGLTALELHLLADSIESPVFPAGLNTFTAPPVPRPEGLPRTMPALPAR